MNMLKTSDVHEFDQALLDLDMNLRPLLVRPHASERAVAAAEAMKRFLAATVPVRLRLILLGLGDERLSTLDAEALISRVLDLALEGGMPPSEIAALFNKKVGGGSES